MKHCMIDLETLGTGTRAAIVSIGAVAFEPRISWELNGDDGPTPFETFHHGLDVADQVRAGATVDADTVYWWMGQSEAARFALLDIEKKDPRKVLGAFTSWWTSNGCEHPWGNGSTFDLRILRESYDLHGMAAPWKFWNEKDLRTLGWMHKERTGSNIKVKRQGTHHDALADAIYQARLVQAVCAPEDPLS